MEGRANLIFSAYCRQREQSKTTTYVLKKVFYHPLAQMEAMRKSSIFVDSDIKHDFKFLEDSLKAAIKYFRSVEKGELGS